MSLLTDMVAHWKLNEASGTREDLHGANDLTDNNTVASATGKLGDAADFESSNSEYLNIADNAELSLGADVAFTWSAWIKPESFAANGALISKRSGNTVASTEYGLFVTTAQQYRFDVGNGSSGAQAIDGAAVSGQWDLVLVWHDPIADKIYIQVNNGTPVETAWSGGTQDTASQLCLGRAANTALSFFDGLIDSVSFWKRVLTSDERTQLYNSGNGLDYEDFGSQQQALAASVSGSTTVSGALRVRKKLSAVIGSGASTFGELSIIKPLEATTTGTTTVTGDLHLVKPLAGSTSGSTTVSGDISTAQILRASVSGSTTVSGALSVSKSLAGSTTGTTSVTGALEVRKKLATSTTGTTTVSGALRVRKKLQAVIGSGTSAFGELTVNVGSVDLAGQSIGTTTVSGALSVTKRLAGSISGSTTVTVTLQIGLAPTLPASVLVRQILINAGQAESFGTEWKIYNAFLPDMPDKAIVVYDSAGLDDGRVMQGEKILHPGVSIQVRSRDYLEAWRKTNRIAEILDQQRRTVIEIPDASSYRVHNVSRKGDILTMGMEPQGDKRRHYFSINADLTLEKI